MSKTGLHNLLIVYAIKDGLINAFSDKMHAFGSES